jgi:glycosyltransferase involved in cell wall biosynthesis
MHICLFSVLGISQDSPNWGGVRTHTRNLVSLLVKEGYRVTLIAGDGQHIENSTLRVIPVGGGLGGVLDQSWSEKASKAFMAIHQKDPVQCIFSVDGEVQGFMDLIRQQGLPVAAFMHLLSIHYFNNKWHQIDGLRALKSYIFRSIPRIFYDTFLDIAYFSKCQMVITGSSTIARQLKTFYRVESNRVMVINNWIDTDVVKKDLQARKRFRESLDIPENDIVFLLVGSLWRPKGFRIAIRAFNDLFREFPYAHLLIVGEGADRTYLQDYLDHNKHLMRNVRLLGLRRQDEMPSIYSSGDIFIMPSLMNEVLAYTLLEAMSCEMPVIATSIFANQEALGENGYFVPRNDKDRLFKAMLDFARNLSIKKTEAANNRKRIKEHFSYQMASNKINELIKILVGESDFKNPDTN